MEKVLAKQCWHLKCIASIKVLWVFCIFKRMSKQFLFLYSRLIPFTENLEMIRVMRSSATVHPGLIPSCVVQMPLPAGSPPTHPERSRAPSTPVSLLPSQACSAWQDTEPQPGLWLCLVNEWHKPVNHFTQPWAGFRLCSCPEVLSWIN